jgi:hypothetical protein
MHLNKLSRLAITLSLGTFVQVVSTPKIVQAQIKPCVLEVSEQPNPPTSGQENPPVTDKPDERVAASTHQQQDPSHIAPPAPPAPPVDAGDIILVTTGTTSSNSARSSAGGGSSPRERCEATRSGKVLSAGWVKARWSLRETPKASPVVDWKREEQSRSRFRVVK